MFVRHFLFLLLLVAAVAGPALYFNVSSPADWLSDNSDRPQASRVPARLSSYSLSPDRLNSPVSLPVASRNVNNDFNPSQNGLLSPPAAPIANTTVLPGDGNGPYGNAIPLEFMPITNLGEIIRFDVSPEWVRQRWERASLTDGDIGLTGMRVPLVTGVNANDLFGSLTYYFDSQQTVQRITFQGWAGDPSRMVGFLTSSYGFKNQPTSAAGLYVTKRFGYSTGVLYMQHSNVIQRSNPTQQVAMMLEVNNPNGPYRLSQEVTAAVFNTHR